MYQRPLPSRIKRKNSSVFIPVGKRPRPRHFSKGSLADFFQATIIPFSLQTSSACPGVSPSSAHNSGGRGNWPSFVKTAVMDCKITPLGEIGKFYSIMARSPKADQPNRLTTKMKTRGSVQETLIGSLAKLRSIGMMSALLGAMAANLFCSRCLAQTTSGIPEPGVCLYGAVASTNGFVPFLGSGVLLAITDGSSTIHLTPSLVTVNSQVYYVALVPFETRSIPGGPTFPATSNTFELTATSTPYTCSPQSTAPTQPCKTPPHSHAVDPSADVLSDWTLLLIPHGKQLPNGPSGY